MYGRIESINGKGEKVFSYTLDYMTLDYVKKEINFIENNLNNDYISNKYKELRKLGLDIYINDSQIVEYRDKIRKLASITKGLFEPF